MSAYATTSDVQARMMRDMGTDELAVCGMLLADASIIIDSVAPSTAGADEKKIVCCRMVIRALGDGASFGTPTGATQGSMSGLGYSQSWTISGGGSVGELYLSKSDKLLLGCTGSIGSYSPVQELVPASEEADA